MLAELWEQADLALLAELASGARGVGATPLSEPQGIRTPSAAEDEALLCKLHSSLAVRWAAAGAWPIEGEEGDDSGTARSLPSPCRTLPRPQLHAPPPSPPCRAASSSSESEHRGTGTNGGASGLGAAPRPEAPQAAPASSFRRASELCPKAPRQQGPEDGETGGGHTDGSKKRTHDFDTISRAVVGRGRNDERPREQPKTNVDGGATREWSEEWLRIADKEQLEKIVPALESAIVRAPSGGRSEAGTQRADIAGLEFVKSQIEEVLILPRLHPELFASALTRPARGLLLFGPPGTGKTLLAKWIATECGATFFNINAGSVLSKWVGEAEKTVKALFQLAIDRQPSVIFIDEIDSMLSKRRDADNESMRRVKNEFLTSMDGADTGAEDKVLLVGATNMPWELDTAALRRLPKRLFVPLPGRSARVSLLRQQLSKHNTAQSLKGALSAADLEAIVSRSEGFSGSDLTQLLREAAMGPIREAAARGGCRAGVSLGAPRDITMSDFEGALRRVRPSFSQDEEARYKAFNAECGTCRGDDAMRDADDDESGLLDSAPGEGM